MNRRQKQTIITTIVSILGLLLILTVIWLFTSKNQYLLHNDFKQLLICFRPPIAIKVKKVSEFPDLIQIQLCRHHLIALVVASGQHVAKGVADKTAAIEAHFIFLPNTV